jgi:CelD/BcsL family acetyltransferase involved in cellulose biosynthesis
MSRGTFRIVTLRTRDEFAAAATRWEALRLRCGDAPPFLGPEWLLSWWDHFGAGGALEALAVERDGELLAALPLRRVKRSIGGIPLRTLESMSNDHSFRFAPLCRPDEPEALEALWTHLRTETPGWDLLVLRDVAVADSKDAVVPFIASARRDGHPCGVWKSYASPYLNLGGTWDEFLERLPGKFRYNLRQRAKRFATLGAVASTVLENEAVTDGVLDECFGLEGRGWTGAEGCAIACDPTLVSFYRRVARDAAARGTLRVARLSLEGRAVAFDLSLHEGGRYYCLKIGYDPAMARYGVGQSLNAAVLEHCLANGVQTYEFLGPRTEAKDAWQPAAHRHVWIHVFGKGPLARAAHFFKFVARERLKPRSAS